MRCWYSQVKLLFGCAQLHSLHLLPSDIRYSSTFYVCCVLYVRANDRTAGLQSLSWGFGKPWCWQL